MSRPVSKSPFILVSVFILTGPLLAVAANDEQEAAQLDQSKQQNSDQSVWKITGEVGEDLEQLSDSDSDDQVPSEAVGINQKITGVNNKIMKFTRLPLSYIQENVPFFKKRKAFFFGRLELDYTNYSSGILEDDSGFDVRRFRVGMAGQTKFDPDWHYKFEMDLSDSENTLSDAYLSRHSSKWGKFTLGNQKISQTLSGQTSSTVTPFMERPLPILAFSLQRRLGIGWDGHLKKMSADVTVFGADPNEDNGSHGWSARGYFDFIKTGFDHIHIGGSFMQLSSDGDGQFRARPESHKTDTRLVDTGILPTADISSAIGLEFAAVRGSVKFQGEFYQTEWSRTNNSNLNFNGWYTEASWFVTGEAANYKNGKFIRPIIKSDAGAWELAVRFSNLNLNDKGIQGGEEDNLSLAVNWYSRDHWRVMGNLIKVESVGPFGEQNPSIAQIRVQYFF